MDSLRSDIEAMRFEDDPLGRAPARSVFGTNPLTGDRNPLVGAEDREKWIAQAIDAIGFDGVSAHLKQQAEAMRNGEVDRAGWYEHVAHCTKLCNPVVRGLLMEHVRQVAARPHWLATFATDRADLSPEVANALHGFVSDQVGKDEPVQFLLIGRASRTGKRAHNRELSARRVQFVRRALTDMGLSGERVTGFWLGYEPPQISDEIARAYGLPHLDDLIRNQSVLLVAYRPGETPGVEG